MPFYRLNTGEHNLYLTQTPNRQCIQKETSGNREQDEELLVALADAVVNPRAVVVHLTYTPTTYTVRQNNR